MTRSIVRAETSWHDNNNDNNDNDNNNNDDDDNYDAREPPQPQQPHHSDKNDGNNPWCNQTEQLDCARRNEAGTTMAAATAPHRYERRRYYRRGLLFCSLLYTPLFVGSMFGWGPMQLLVRFFFYVLVIGWLG